MTNVSSDQLIVVGVDGSPASEQALSWAARYAAALGGKILALGAWHLPANVDWAVTPDIDLEQDAKTEVDRVVAMVHGEFPSVEIESKVVNGYAGPALLEVSKSAQLLVVGSRGHGAFAGMLLGSVSAHVVHHATCPVLIMRHPAES